MYPMKEIKQNILVCASYWFLSYPFGLVETFTPLLKTEMTPLTVIIRFK